MAQIITTKEKLKERIKELTCLYAISSYIANCNLDNIDLTINAIALSLKDAVRFPKDASVKILILEESFIKGREPKEKVFISSAIKMFNKSVGAIKVSYSKLKYNENSFLNEEKQLLQKVALEIGNLLERKQILENEAVTRRQIEHADRLTILGEITAGIAHELNTPLANILGYAELLDEKFKDNAETSADLEKITNSAIYSREVVKKLMFFSCDMPQQMQLTNIVPIIKDAISLLKPNFLKKNINCQLHIEQEEIMLRVDAIQLTQVIFNLVINAIYFSPKDGLIKVSVIQNLKEVEILIIDQGSGISPVDSDNIFNPFYTTKPVGEGSGLGLSVVHGIVKSHKGSIKHKPNKLKGTIFSVNFPKI